MENLGTWAPPPDVRETQLAAQMDALKNPVQLAASTLNAFPFLFVLFAFAAGLSLLGLFAFCGRINFWQALAASVSSAFPIIVIQKVLGLIISYLKSPDDLPSILNPFSTLPDNLVIASS